MGKAKILVADDSIVARRQLVSQLKELDFSDVVEAASGAEGLKILQEAQSLGLPFDLVITDLRMPNMSGADFLRHIAADVKIKNVQKLIVSVETERGTVLEAFKCGADGYILKPTTLPVLKAKLEKMLTQKVPA